MIPLAFLFAIILQAVGAWAGFVGVVAFGMIATTDIAEIHLHVSEAVGLSKRLLLLWSAFLAIVGLVAFVLGLWIGAMIGFGA